MIEADSFAWTDVCLTLPKKLTDRDAIAGPTTEVSAALETASTRARSKRGRALAAQLQREIAARRDRKKFVRIGPGGSRAEERPGTGRRAAGQPGQVSPTTTGANECHDTA